MERIIILLEVLAFVSLMVFAFLSNSRCHVGSPIHLLNFEIWPLLAFGFITAVIFFNSETKIVYMPHAIWHILMIALLVISTEQFRRFASRYVKTCKLACFYLLFAIFTETLAIVANIVNFAL